MATINTLTRWWSLVTDHTAHSTALAAHHLHVGKQCHISTARLTGLMNNSPIAGSFQIKIWGNLTANTPRVDGMPRNGRTAPSLELLSSFGNGFGIWTLAFSRHCADPLHQVETCGCSRLLFYMSVSSIVFARNSRQAMTGAAIDWQINPDIWTFGQIIIDGTPR